MIRVVHFLNQFFAGIGGEDRAGEPPGAKPGAVGPGMALQAAMGPAGKVEVTVWCGDNYMAEQPSAARAFVEQVLKEHRPDLVVAGPAFASGRYGLACGQVAAAARTLGIPVVLGLHDSNPAVEAHRRDAIIVPTGDSASGMREAIAVMARIGLKLGRKEPLAAAYAEGYMPTGRRVNTVVAERGAKRAVQMLRNRLQGQEFRTEFELPRYDIISPAAPVSDLREATVALVTESGCVPKGNPDAILSAWATHWVNYPINGVTDLRPDAWEYIHGGYDTTFVDEEPDRGVPLDSLRQLEAEGRFGRLHNHLLSTCGNMAPLSTAQRFGREMAAELHKSNVQAAILTAT